MHSEVGGQSLKRFGTKYILALMFFVLRKNRLLCIFRAPSLTFSAFFSVCMMYSLVRICLNFELNICK